MTREDPAVPQLLEEPGRKPEPSLVVTYCSDYNIVELDLEVLSMIDAHLQAREAELKSKLSEVAVRLEECTSVILIREAEMRRSRLQVELTNIQKKQPLRDYSLATGRLLSRYKEIPMEERVIDVFMASPQKAIPDSIRERIVDAYMEAVLKLQLPRVSITKKKADEVHPEVCLACEASLLGCEVLLSGLLICACGCVNKRESSSSGSKDYYVLGNFLKTHKRYIGDTPPKCDMGIVLSQLDEHFLDQGEPSGEYFRSQPLDEWGGKEGTSVDDLCVALKCLGFKDLYKSYRYVGHHYYGWQLFDLRHIEQQIVKNFNLKQEAWMNNMSEEERGNRSSLSTEYRLCREYQHAGHNCRLSDFKISRKPATLRRYDQSYAIMCKLSGFEDIFSLE